MISLTIDFSNKDKKEKLWKILKTLKPKKYDISIKQHRENRSNPQNRYYWGVCLTILSQHTGFTTEEMHEHLKNRFLPVFKTLPTGEQVRISGSTAELDTAKFEEYLETVKQFAIQELDCLIPDPSDIYESIN
jgi:ADP-heptose:LPS heptosyltransferase